MHINFGGLQSPNFKYINIYYENFGKLKFLPLKYRSIANISLCHLNHFYYINRFFFWLCQDPYQIDDLNIQWCYITIFGFS